MYTFKTLTTSITFPFMHSSYVSYACMICHYGAGLSSVNKLPCGMALSFHARGLVVMVQAYLVLSYVVLYSI